MHELAVCQALLTEVRRAVGADAGPVTRVVVRIGPLSGIEPQLLKRAFDFARVGGIAAEAELAVESAPVRVQCLLCHRVSDAPPNRLICPSCGTPRTVLVTGDELVLQRVEFRAIAPAAPLAAA